MRLSLTLLLGFSCLCSTTRRPDPAHAYTVRVAYPSQVRMYWKYQGHPIKTFDRLKEIEPRLSFALNGGMFLPDFSPCGLYTEGGKELRPLRLSRNSAYNFGLQPQGVFWVASGRAGVCSVQDYRPRGVEYATQSAPILVIDGQINPQLPHSTSAVVRNGVGIFPDGKILLVVSREPVTFQEFAAFFQSHGCESALYLDGAISEAYQVGDRAPFCQFGPMIGVVK